jgi:hypothetical protein
MSVRTLRIVETASNDSQGRNYEGPIQLSLFDFQPPQQLVCLPMRELHGKAFVRALHQYRPCKVFDLRSHPYFDLHSLNRDEAFAAFAQVSSVYHHRPIRLFNHHNHADRWGTMRETFDLLSELIDLNYKCENFVALIDSRDDASLLKSAVQHYEMNQGANWKLLAL